MSGPFIFIATNRLKPRALEAEKRRVPQLCDFIEANEPRLIAFNEYVDDDVAQRGNRPSSKSRTPSRWSSTWASCASTPRR